MRILICISVFLLSRVAAAQEVSIIPRPAEMAIGASESSFILKPTTLLVLEGSNMENAVSFFNEYLQRIYKFKLKTIKDTKSKNAIRLNYERKDNALPGAYDLKIDGNGVYIAGDNEQGVFYGIQSLIQLLPLPEHSGTGQLELPYVTIYDSPRFAYRGLHLDCARHFWPVSFIKKYIDFIALHKMNYFHWHLTDDQGWRIEIKKYPKLTSVGGWRNGTIIGRYPGTGNDGLKYGGSYTQEQVKDIVAYAAKRYITVVPEIEMPGHASAAIAAYPELSCFPDSTTQYPKLCTWSGSRKGKHVQQTWGVFDDVFCAGKENTFEFLENVMDEVLVLFPSKYIHVGGDECPKEHWKNCPSCQQRMKENKLKDEHELQSYFIQRMEKYLNNKGRTLIGWDEILEGGLAPNAVVMSWRGEKGGIEAAKDKHQVIMTPGNPVYFDHTQTQNEDSVTIGGYNPIEKVYEYEPVPKELSKKQAEYVFGAQANLWAEYLKNTNKVEYMLLPRLSALSEILWSPAEDKNWTDFESRLLTQFKRYTLWGANYSRAYFDMGSKIEHNILHDGIQWTLSSKQRKVIKITTDKGVPVISNTFPNGDVVVDNIKKPVTLKALLVDGKNVVSTLVQKFNFNKATGRTISLKKDPSKSYPGDGAITLVNGVINEKGFARSREFLGWSGEDCEAVIDLGESKPISFVVVNLLDRKSSWIWRPQSAEVLGSADGKTWYPLKMTDDFHKLPNSEKGMITVSFKSTYARYVKVIVTNWGDIPSGNPGAGKKAWLFIDEIEVN